MPPAIEIRALRKSFGGFTLGPLDMTVPEGAIYGLVGPNGAGKTTTIDLLFGMGAKDAGQITVLGLDHPDSLRSAIGRYRHGSGPALSRPHDRSGQRGVGRNRRSDGIVAHVTA